MVTKELELRPADPSPEEISEMIDNHEDRIQQIEEILIKAGLLDKEERIPNLGLAVTQRDMGPLGTMVVLRRIPAVYPDDDEVEEIPEPVN